jgi:predicted RNA-binding protein
VLAEYVTTLSQRNGLLVLTDIMGKETEICGSLALADLTRGVLVIDPK